MTETEWLSCTDPKPMLEFLEGKASDRKLWLFACACCRLVWHLLPDCCHWLVEAVEQYAEGATATSDLRELFDGYYPHQVALSTASGGNQAAEAVGHLGWPWRSRPIETGWPSATTWPWQVWYTSQCVARSVAESLAKSMPWEQARQRQGQLLHDIFGPLIVRPVAIDIAWLSWNDSTILKFVSGIYDDRTFADLPILADALEDAGCTDADILTHCRVPGEHVRGCWLLDALLRKNQE
jgi:hypothetical protein